MPLTVGSRVVNLIEQYDHLRCDTTEPIGAP